MYEPLALGAVPVRDSRKQLRLALPVAATVTLKVIVTTAWRVLPPFVPMLATPWPDLPPRDAEHAISEAVVEDELS